jgi:hypothetical protein
MLLGSMTIRFSVGMKFEKMYLVHVQQNHLAWKLGSHSHTFFLWQYPEFGPVKTLSM